MEHHKPHFVNSGRGGGDFFGNATKKTVMTRGHILLHAAQLSSSAELADKREPGTALVGDDLIEEQTGAITGGVLGLIC